jgi:small acid-soluble spore protein F (minor alpha/beta-type SASP)
MAGGLQQHTIGAISSSSITAREEFQHMSRRRRGMMSEELKTELAKELGFYETVERDGWGGIRAQDAGNMVKRAIQLAEQAARKSQL